MCGIMGYTGTKEVQEILLKALETLEYRGYDSSGITMVEQDTKNIKTYKCAGRVKDLRNLCQSQTIQSSCGIGHTRWATHGGVTDANAHPHTYGNVTIIHNGIIENYETLKKDHRIKDYLRSETDSEVIAAILDFYYEGNPIEAIQKIVGLLQGTFALGILFHDKPGNIYGIRNVSPIVVTATKDGGYMASDITAICEYFNRYFVLPEYHILELSGEGAKLYSLEGEEVVPSYLEVDWDISYTGKQGYPFYMEKEIMEQPRAIKDTMESRIKKGLPDFTEDGIPDGVLSECKQITILGCGTAMNVGLVAKSFLQGVLGIHIDVEIASEFIYSTPVITENTLVIAISQSGETIDTLEAIKYAKRHGAKVLSILNVKGSSISRESDYTLYTNAGPEIAVASTKAYTTQVMALYLVGARMALLRGKFTKDQTMAWIHELERVPDIMNKVLEEKEQLHRLSSKILLSKDVFMIGRGLDFSILLEASLKLKEITYIHSEAYSSGELKHGTIALITEETPVIALVTQKRIMSKEISNIKETQSRGANIILLLKEDLGRETLTSVKDVFYLPSMEDEMMVFPAVVAMQLIAYYVALDKGLDPDKPRNLAKVVTVE